MTLHFGLLRAPRARKSPQVAAMMNGNLFEENRNAPAVEVRRIKLKVFSFRAVRGGKTVARTKEGR